MKGYVLIKDSFETDEMINKCLLLVKNLSIHDMKKYKITSRKWNWKRFWFIKKTKELPIKNFLLQDKLVVIKFLENLQACIKQNGDVSLSLIAYNELVKLSKGDIEINSIWLVNY